MAQSLPWSVKGIDADTREAARDAARKAGMSVSDWLEHVIREQALKSEGPDAGATPADLQDRLRRLSHSGSRQAMERGAQRGRQGGPNEIEALINHAAQLESRTRESEAKTTQALESIIGWIEKAESRMSAAERAAAERQERATSVIADAIKTVSSRVADVERRAVGGAEPIARDVAMRAAAGPDRRTPFSREALGQAVSEIQSRQRELDQGTARPRPSAILHNLREDSARFAAGHQVERRMGDRRAEVTPIMNGLRSDLAQLKSEISRLSENPGASRLEDSIRDLSARLEARPAPAPIEELARPLARIEAEISRLQASDAGARVGRIESEIQKLGARIEALADMGGDPRILAAAVHEIGALKQALLTSAPAARMDELSRQFARLAEDMARMREEVAHHPAGEVERAIEDMREALLRETRDAQGIGHGLLQRIAHQIDSVSSLVANLPAGGVDEHSRDQLSALSEKLDQLAQRTQPESDALARRIESLAIKLDDLSGMDATGLIGRIDRLSEQIEALTARGPARVEQQIDQLTARIEALAEARAHAPAPAVDLTPIEVMIGDLARRIEDASRPEAGTTGLQSLERQIAELGERLASQPGKPAGPDGLERTLQDLMRYLGTLREETTSAVDRAARAAVADVLGAAPRQADTAGEVSRLRDDLAGLKDVHVSIDQRTHSALGAVNDTLEKIVGRLAQLEDDISRERPVPAAPEAPAVDMRPRRRAEPPFAATTPSVPAEPAPAPSAMPFRVPRDVQRREPAPSPADSHETFSLDELPAPRRGGKAQEPSFDAAPDMPLEPGSGRPRPGAESSAPAPAQPAAPPSGSLNPSLIAAARRAAMAASAEADALARDAKTGGKAAKPSRLALPLSLKETLEKRRKPILLGLAAIVLALGAGHVATSLLSDPAPEPQRAAAIETQRPAVEAPRDAAGQGTPRAEAPRADAPRADAAPLPTPARPATPPKDQTSLSAPSVSPASVEATGSVRPNVEMASLSPALASPDPTRFSAAPGPVTDLGELAPGIGTPGLRRAAMAGDANAVHELAVRAADGIGMARDQKLALRLFERAAAAGSAPAQFRLANIHEKGIGTARDAKLAVTWYKRAAEKGNAKAMHNLAVLLAEGADGRPDYAAAAELFRKAAELGVRDSQFNLAILLGRGLGVEQDMTQAYTWFAVAARQGDADAAKKRDEVGAKLTPVDLAAGRSASEAWKPKTPDPAANEVAAPAEGWDPQPKSQRPPAKPRAT